jgi:hypothetical protein
MNKIKFEKHLEYYNRHIGTEHTAGWTWYGAIYKTLQVWYIHPQACL